MNDQIQIRPAKPDDADVASALLYSAYTHRQLNYPLSEEEEDRFGKRLQHFFRLEDNRFSYQYAQVAEYGSTVLGLALSFAGRDEPRLNAAVGWQLEREAEDDEWYVDALAVFKPWGRRGIGTRLLQTAEQQAQEHHVVKVALNVALDNEAALALYRRLHYAVTQKTFLYQHPYVRMVKTLGKD